MKQTLLLFLMTLLATAAHSQEWNSPALSLYRSLTGQKTPAKTFADDVCTPVEENNSLKAPEHYELNCHGTLPLASFVVDVQNSMIQNCRGQAEQISQLKVNANSVSPQDLAQIKILKEQAETLGAGLYSTTHIQSQKLHQSWSEIWNGKLLAAGGLPCKDLREGLYNHYDRVNLRVLVQMQNETNAIETILDEKMTSAK